MIDFACPNKDEVELLKQHYRRTVGTVSQRAHAVLLPAKFDIKRDETLVEKRIREIRRMIKPYLTNPNWVVLAADESRLIWEAIIRRAWLPKGEKTVLNALDTNPQEYIWRYAKDEISNRQYGNMKELTYGFTAIVIGRNYPYQI